LSLRRHRRVRAFVGPWIERPARPADERGRGTTCWFAVRDAPLIAGAGSGLPRGALSGAGRAARERLRSGGPCAARTVPRSLRGRSGPTPLGRCR